MQELIDNQNVKLSDPKIYNNKTALAEVNSNLNLLTQSQSGWQNILDTNNQLYDDASNGKIQSVSGLVPQSLLVNGSVLVRTPDGSLGNTTDVNIIEKFSAFSFSGGGSTITYTEIFMSATDSITTKDSGSSLGGGLIVSADGTIAAVAFASQVAFSGSSITSVSKSQTTSLETDITRSFTLSDPDIGDSFDVQVVCSKCTFFVRMTHISRYSEIQCTRPRSS